MNNDHLKFRIWSKCMGRYLEDEYFPVLLHDGTVAFLDENEDHNELYELDHSVTRRDLIIERCTGLTDKNGVLVYEGTVVSFVDSLPPVNGGTVHAVCRYSEGHFWLSAPHKKPRDQEACAWCNYGFEGMRNAITIIGNANEDPELLEVE